MGGEIIGRAYGLWGIAEFLRRAGIEDADEAYVASSALIEWRGGGPQTWGPEVQGAGRGPEMHEPHGGAPLEVGLVRRRPWPVSGTGGCVGAEVSAGSSPSRSSEESSQEQLRGQRAVVAVDTRRPPGAGRHRDRVTGRGIRHRIARKGIESSQRLGRHRWVVERTVSWLVGCRRLHRRYERKAEHFLAFAGVAAALINYRRWATSLRV